MPTPYIVGAVRTPIGRAGGALAAIRPDDLAAVAVRALVERTPIPAERIDDVILGCANQAGEDNRNVARMALLLAGLPVAIPGRTVNRLCGSGLQAAIAPPRTRSVRAKGDIFVAGGVESMTRAPYITLKSGKAWDRNPPVTADSTVGWRFVNPRLPTEWTISLGETAEKVAREYGVSRQDQDEFAVESQRRAQDALARGVFGNELVEVEAPGPDGRPGCVDRDEPPRAGVTAESLAKLKPAFVKDGTVTAGTASGINDGAAALGVVSEAALDEHGFTPLARIVATAVAGVDPSVMSIGPVPAVRKALSRAGISAKDLAYVELNEAFAAQAVACIGVGQGIAVVVENPDGRT